MKADTFAKLAVLETLVDAEVAYYLEHSPSIPAYRARVAALADGVLSGIDPCDEETAIAAHHASARLLRELQPADDAVIRAATRFKRRVNGILAREMEPEERRRVATWAVVVDQLLATLAREYREGAGDADRRADERIHLLLARIEDGVARLALLGGAARVEGLRAAAQRLRTAVRRRQPTDTVSVQIAALQLQVRALAGESSLARLGGFVVRQLLEPDGAPEAQRASPLLPVRQAAVRTARFTYAQLRRLRGSESGAAS